MYIVLDISTPINTSRSHYHSNCGHRKTFCSQHRFGFNTSTKSGCLASIDIHSKIIHSSEGRSVSIRLYRLRSRM